MAASASFPRRRESIVEPLTPPQQTMDDNPLSPGILPRNVELAIPLTVFFLFVPLAVDSTLFWSPKSVIKMLLLSFAISFSITTLVRLNYRRKPIVASRLWAVTDLYVREMNNLLSIMKLWESQSCEKVDNFGNNENTIARLSSFLNAMESLDLMNKIYELKGLSRHLNLVTKHLIRSPLHNTLELITTWSRIGSFYLLQVLVSEG